MPESPSSSAHLAPGLFPPLRPPAAHVPRPGCHQAVPRRPLGLCPPSYLPGCATSPLPQPLHRLFPPLAAAPSPVPRLFASQAGCSLTLPPGSYRRRTGSWSPYSRGRPRGPGWYSAQRGPLQRRRRYTVTGWRGRPSPRQQREPQHTKRPSLTTRRYGLD